MEFLPKIKQWLGFSAATELPPAPIPKAPKGGGASFPGFSKTTDTASAKIQQTTLDVANADLTQAYRAGATPQQTIRDLVRVSPELAGARAAHIRLGIPEKWILIARDPDGSFNVDATRLAMQIARRMDTMPDYDNGFSQVGSLRSVSEALAREMFETGAMAMELVLDKSRLPFKFAPIPASPDKLIFYTDGKGTKPTQKVGGEEIDLDLPTFFYTSIDQSLLDAYGQSPLESAVQPVLASTQFLSDMRRLCARHVFQRYDVSIDEEKFRMRIPPDILNDPTKLQEFFKTTISEINDAIENMGVEEALVHFDYFTVETIKSDGSDTPGTFDTVGSIYNGKIATAAKTPPSILGMGSTSLTVASTEALTFLKNVDGMVRQKLMEMYSKAFTLAVRLMGLDVTVEFEFDDIELKPKSELEAFFSMKQDRLLRQLSLGLMCDEEVCLRLTGNLPPKGYKPLMGTMFMDPVSNTQQPGEPGNPASNTSAAGKQSPTGAKGKK